MKVLYIGYYKEKSDWGIQTVNQILALERAGVDVACRSIELTAKETPAALKHLERKDIGDCTHCIQHVFPEHMVGTGKFVKNVGFLTNNFVKMNHSSWVEKLSMMDEVWVPSQSCWRENLPESIKEIATVIPLALDIDSFNRRYGNMNIPEAQGKFKVYSFASPHETNGLTWLLAAFHSEFDVVEDATLILCVKADSPDGRQEVELVENLSRKVKENLRLHRSGDEYTKDIILAANLTESQQCELHQHCDSYVTTNTEFTFPLSEIHAAGFGNNPIVAGSSSVTEYVGKDNGVPSICQVMQSKSSMFPDQMNGHDYFLRPDEYHLKLKLREAYNKWKKNPMEYKLDSKKAALEQLSEFSMNTIGNKMKEALSV